jgi:hypothetical protein
MRRLHPARWPLVLLACLAAAGCTVEPTAPDVPIDDAPRDALESCEGEAVRCGAECVVLASDDRHCGMCGRACLPGTSCVLGMCDCLAPMLACSGACVEPATSEEHCGSCGRACAAGEECSGGECYPACRPDAPDRCTVGGDSVCVDFDIDPTNCGDCGIGCVPGTLCVAGRCACPSGLTSCGAGCVDLRTDATNCGGCLTSCGAGGTCIAGECSTCGGGLTLCGDPARCWDTNTSRLHCGACGRACASGETCNAGTCECSRGLVDCGTGCVDPMTTRDHCGDCATDCSATGTCVAGSCVCAMGDVLCGRECANFMTSHEHCGGCDRPCAATEVCMAGACAENDACAANSVDVSAGGTFTGRFADVDNDYPLGCHTGMFVESAYRFTIPADGMLRDVTLNATTTGGMFASSAFLQITSDCSSSAAMLRCVRGPALVQRGLGPGTYYILLESSAADATDWSLTVSITTAAPRNPADACATAMDVTPTLDGTGRGMRTVTVPISTLEGDGGVSCGTSSPTARDGYFALTLAAPADVTFRSSAAATFHYTALQATCGVAGSELRCRSGASPLAQIFRSLAAGTHYFVVQTTAASGDVSVTAEVAPATPIPMNDTCPGVTLDVSSPVSRTDTLLGLEDDLLGGTCAGSGRPDAFYTFTLATARRVIISAAPLSGTASMYLTLRSGCAGSALFCSSGSSASINQMLAAGTYVIQVEQSLADAGDFSLSVF